MKEHLESLLAGERLSEDALHLIFREMFAGKYSASEIAAFLVLQQKLGETYLELFAGAQAMRNAANKVVISDRVRPLTDNCGTGGDSSNSFNISTASAIVASAYGLKVAKHGNRSVSSKCGSADLLFACGLPDTLSPEQTGKLLEKTGFTFFFAPHFHPVMKHVMPVRKALRVRTIFNLLGPLANPIAPEYQVIGVGSKRYLEPMALALQKLGVQRALIVHSRDGLDEISPADLTDGVWISGPTVKDIVINPKELGYTASLDALKGGDAAFNKGLLEEMLAGAKPEIANCVALNAGAALWIGGIAEDHATGSRMAQESIASGQAKSYFSEFLSAAKALA